RSAHESQIRQACTLAPRSALNLFSYHSLRYFLIITIALKLNESYPSDSLFAMAFYTTQRVLNNATAIALVTCMEKSQASWLATGKNAVKPWAGALGTMKVAEIQVQAPVSAKGR